MAYCITPQWSTSYTPQCKLTVTIQSETATQAILAYTLQYVTHGYTASTSAAKSYSAVIAGETVASGTVSINGKSTFTIASGTKPINKTTAAQTIAFSCSFGFNLTWTGVYGGTKSASGSIGVSAKTSYTIAYNANGGSGAPSSQTKWHGTNITLSSTKPTRNGYTFKGWATSSGGSVAYAAGASYTANASATLYAVWQAITYAVTYNANGGTGAPASQTKTHGVTLTLSSTKPTRTNYTFKGWGTSAGASTVAYAAGASYTGNAAITLYAIWELAYTKPRITNFVLERCDSSGNASEEGTYALISFKWETDKTISSIVAEWESEAGGNGNATIAASGTSGTVSKVIGGGNLLSDITYSFKTTVTDANGYSVVLSTLASAKYVIDFMAGGKGAAMNKAAELEGVFDIDFKTRHLGGIMHPVLEPETDLNDVKTPNTYIGANVGSNNYVNCPLDSGTFTLVVEGAGEDGQVKQTLSRCSMSEPNRYHRYFYQDTWGEWVSDMPAVIYVQETGTDLNNYKLTGVWYFNTSHTPLNLPSGCVNGWLIVFRADSGAIKQIWLRYGSQNTNDFNTYVRTGNATTWSNWKRFSTEPVVLYDNASGSNGTITLSETAANFEYIEIFFTDNNGLKGGYNKVDSPNGEKIELSVIEATSNTYIRRTAYEISGKTLTPANGGFVRVDSGVVSTTLGTNYIKITKVLGHRA